MRATNRFLTTRRLLAVACVGMLGVSACGSSSGGAAATATTVAGKSSDSTAKSSGGSSGDIADTMVAAFKAVEKGDCGKANSIGDSIDLAAGQDGFGQIDDIGKAFDKLGSSGPSELRADFTIMGKAFTAMAKAYGDLGLDDPSKLAEIMKDPAKAAQLAEAAKAMENTDFQGAGDRIGAWMEKKCPGMGNG